MKSILGRDIPSDLGEMLDPLRTAVLVIDVQNDFLDSQGHFARHGRDVVRMHSMLPRLEALISAARRSGVHVVFVRQLTLPDGRSDSDAWLYFKTRDGKSPDYTISGSWGESYFRLAPHLGDTEVRKFRPSAFHGTELSRLLRVRGVTTVVTTGVLTQGCVLATTLDASFHDFFTIVAADAVASTDGALHDNALMYLRSRYDCPSVAELIATWEDTPA